MTELITKGKLAREASYKLSQTTTDERNAALFAMADALLAKADYIIEENAKDLKAAVENNMNTNLQDRLRLDLPRISAMAEGIRQVASLPDPLGRILTSTTRPNGLKIDKVSVPLGVIGIIYEARPNVTADAAALCVKSGNATILRGGKEAINSNIAIAATLSDSATAAGLPDGSILLVEDTSRESATALMRLNDYLDVLIPRGGAGLIRAVMENSSVPVIETGTGNCHVYVDKTANLDMACDIVVNAKTTRPSVCNSEEKLLVHESLAAELLPMLLPKLEAKGVEIRGDEQTLAIYPDAKPIKDDEWDYEYLDLILGVGVVRDVGKAIDHINTHSSHHSDAIVTNDTAAAEQFLSAVDSAAVYVNASTRFTDGFEFGFGAEIGISTQKVHARGPMGLPELTTTKYKIYGTGQVRM